MIIHLPDIHLCLETDSDSALYNRSQLEWDTYLVQL